MGMIFLKNDVWFTQVSKSIFCFLFSFFDEQVDSINNQTKYATLLEFTPFIRRNLQHHVVFKENMSLLYYRSPKHTKSSTKASYTTPRTW